MCFVKLKSGQTMFLLKAYEVEKEMNLSTFLFVLYLKHLEYNANKKVDLKTFS